MDREPPAAPVAKGDVTPQMMQEMVAFANLMRDAALPIEVRALRAAREPKLYGADLAQMTAEELAQVAPAIRAETGVDLMALQRAYGGPAPVGSGDAMPLAPDARRARKGLRPSKNLPYPFIARLLGEGLRPEAVARMLGCDAAQIERNLRRSPRFRRWIENEKRAIAASAEAAANLARARAAVRLRDAVASGALTEQPTIARRILEIGLESEA